MLTVIVLLNLVALVLPHQVPHHVRHALRNSYSFKDVVERFTVRHAHNGQQLRYSQNHGHTAKVRINSGGIVGRKQATMEAQPLMDSPVDPLGSAMDQALLEFEGIRQGNDTCYLQSVCVPVPIEFVDPAIVHFPECYQMNQCIGSCCNAASSCHPLQKREVSKKVIEFRYLGANSFNLTRSMDIMMEEHLSCSCKDCSEYPPCRPGQVMTSNCDCQLPNYNSRSSSSRVNRRTDSSDDVNEDMKVLPTADFSTERPRRTRPRMHSYRRGSH